MDNKPDVKELFHDKIRAVFTEEELWEIYRDSCLAAFDVYVIFNHRYFFEITADYADQVEIYCLDLTEGYHTDSELIDRGEFLRRLRAHPAREIKFFEVT